MTMRNSNYEAVGCNGDGCDEVMRVRFTVMDAFGGRMYCEECIENENLPESHPQHPDYDGDFEI